VNVRGDAWWIAALLQLYPRAYRDRYDGELRRAMLACVDRERDAGSPAWLTRFRLSTDAVASAWLARRDARRLHLRFDDFRTGDPLMQSIAADIRYALRLLRRGPGFTATVIATFALAIGANTAIFGIVNGVLLRALPFNDPGRLVFIYEGIPSQPKPFGVSAPDVMAFRERARSYDGFAAFKNVEYELSGIDQPESSRCSASVPRSAARSHARRTPGASPLRC
jgi:hypothetical protein